ncbi:hypothetical protein BT69DRAFT_1340966, partial [Atractiella rhizophila]
APSTSPDKDILLPASSLPLLPQSHVQNERARDSTPPPRKKRKLSPEPSKPAPRPPPKIHFKQQFVQSVSPRSDTIHTITFGGKDRMKMIPDLVPEATRRSQQEARRQQQAALWKEDKDSHLERLMGTSDPRKLQERFSALEVANGRLRARVLELEEELEGEKSWKREVGRLWNQAKMKGGKEEVKVLARVKDWMGRWFDQPSGETERKDRVGEKRKREDIGEIVVVDD